MNRYTQIPALVELTSWWGLVGGHILWAKGSYGCNRLRLLWGYSPHILRYLVAGITRPFHFHSPRNCRLESGECSLYTLVLSALELPSSWETGSTRSIQGVTLLTSRKVHLDITPTLASYKWTRTPPDSEARVRGITCSGGSIRPDVLPVASDWGLLPSPTPQTCTEMHRDGSNEHVIWESHSVSCGRGPQGRGQRCQGHEGEPRCPDLTGIDLGLV